jgi:hypothetical protein
MVVLFSWDMSSFQSKQLFSVASSNQKRSVKARAIVTHIGTEHSGGEWLCSKDGKDLASCTHLRLAQRYLKKLGGSDLDKDDEATIDIPGPLDVGECLGFFV